MKGVLICGGTGTRLRPLTDITNKSLLPIYDKPLISYPLATLRKGGITDIAVVTGPEHMDQISNYLGDGSRFGCTFSFVVQKEPKGIAQALGLAEPFADGESVCAILGDNIFFDDLSSAIRSFKKGSRVFLKEVPDPARFGVAEVKGDRVVSIEEKPAKPKSSLAQTGCYIFDNRCFDVIRGLKPSDRGELEITDVTKQYLFEDMLSFTVLKDEWIDAGTFESLFRASAMVRERKNKT
ncbi:MAG: sugar phosphate nucleotidyltransferase [Candidatus Peribacteraceae bacterium]|nr:sugar phosphate nucleotidyltransferase [Candidatus Peribacteraceae bacterium]